MIELRDVSYRVASRVLLDGVNLQLRERRIAVIGANGSGKSSFARLLNGLLIPSSGSVLVDGLDTHDSGAEVRKKVGFVFQNPDSQIVFPIVVEDLAFGLKNLGIDKKEIAQHVNEMLDYCGLANFGDRLIHQLSGGEKQLIAVAGVLVMKPQVIVFDEPTTLLDLKNKRKICTAIDALEQQVVLVTHDLEYIDHFERVLCFDNGRIVCDGSPDGVVDFYRRLMS